MDSRGKIPNKLSEAGKELPFKVPGHYFDDFPARMQSMVERDSQPSAGKRLTLMDYIKPALGLAAAFAAVFVLVYWPARLVNHSYSSSDNQGISDEEKIINLVEPVDDHTFFSLLDDDASDEKLNSTEIESYIAANYSDYDIYIETQK
mgnify:CR=1 FL=1